VEGVRLIVDGFLCTDNLMNSEWNLLESIFYKNNFVELKISLILQRNKWCGSSVG
jgi:hypothetical protein